MDCVVPLKSEFDHVPAVTNPGQIPQMTIHPGLTMTSEAVHMQPPPPPPQISVIDQHKFQPDVSGVSNPMSAYDVKGNIFILY